MSPALAFRQTQDRVVARPWFFYGFLLFWFAGVIFYAQAQKGELALWFSTNRTPFWNAFFRYATLLGEHWGYLIVAPVLALRNRLYLIALPTIGILAGLVSGLLKKFFAEPRPYLYYKELEELAGIVMVPLVTVNGGANSFPSGHTTSAFALYTFVVLALRPKIGTQLFCLLAAVLTGLSRVYLFQHFLEDILFGSLLGVVIGYLVYLGLSLLMKEDKERVRV